MNGRSPEARYARDFAGAAFHVSRAPLREPGAGVSVPLAVPLCADASGALAEFRRRQRTFFMNLDVCKVDDDALRTSSDTISTPEVASSWCRELDARIHTLRSGSVPLAPSHTRVIEAAGFLLRGGLLNVKGTQHQNVKQGRALLHWAWWLQQEMSRRWIADGTLAAPPVAPDPTPLYHVLVGGAGCGKTTTLRVVGALLDFFLAAAA